MRPIMPYYQPEKPQIMRQLSEESECTDYLIKRHHHHRHLHRQTVAVAVADGDGSTDDDIFAGRRIERAGSVYTDGSNRSKSTPVTVEESLSGEFHQQFLGVQQPSASYNDGSSYDQSATRRSHPENRYRSFREPEECSYTSGSFQEGESYPPEQQKYRQDQQHLSQHEGRSSTDEAEPYYDDDEENQENYEEGYHHHHHHYGGDENQENYEEGYHHHHHHYGGDENQEKFEEGYHHHYYDGDEDQEKFEEGYHHHHYGGDENQEKYEEGYYHDERRQQLPYRGEDYHQGRHPHDRAAGYPQRGHDSQDYGGHRRGRTQDCNNGYQQDCPGNSEGYNRGYPEDYHDGHERGNSRDCDGYREGHPQSHYQEEDYRHSDDPGRSDASYDRDQIYSSYTAKRNAEGHWEGEDESEIDGGTIASKTLNTNLEGMKYIPREPYDNNYYGDEETAFDYSDDPYSERKESAPVPFDGASTIASPLHDDDRSQGSQSIWEGPDLGLRNRSLMDNPVSPLSHTQFTIGNHTEYTSETQSTRRPVSKFIKKAKKSVGGWAAVTYQDGEFQVRRDNSKGSVAGDGDGRRGSRRTKGGRRTESATVLDIMFNVGRDLIVGTSRKERRGRQKEPAAGIVEGFKEMFRCGAEDDEAYS